MSDGALQTEFAFTLPNGYVDADGTRHTEGRMRLATAGDEISPLSDPRVQSNDSYLTVILLSRVVTELGSLDSVGPEVIEDLFVADMEHLQAMYERINDRGADAVTTVCPDCGTDFDVAVEGGSHVEADPANEVAGPPSAADVGGTSPPSSIPDEAGGGGPGNGSE